MMKSISIRSIAIAAISMTSLLGLVNCSSSDSGSPSTSDELRIGLEAPLSGAQKDVGIGMLRGAQLAADEINAAGGINGKKVTIVAIDDAADPEVGIAAAQDAIEKGLDAVVGPYNSGVGVKTLPLYVDAGVFPMRLTSADATEGLGFTLQPMTSQIAPIATEAITTWAKAKNVAIIFDQSTTHTEDANAAMIQNLEAAGVTVTIDKGIDPGALDYSTVVSEVLQSNPDLVYLITYYPEGGLIAQTMLASNTSALCLADYGAYDSGFVSAAGIAAAQNCPIVGVPAPADFPNSETLVDAYFNEYGTSPGTWSPYSYDSVKMLADALGSVGSNDAAKIRAYLVGEAGWSGWTGTVSFDANSGNRIPAPVVVLETSDDGTLHISTAWATETGFKF